MAGNGAIGRTKGRGALTASGGAILLADPGSASSLQFYFLPPARGLQEQPREALAVASSRGHGTVCQGNQRRATPQQSPAPDIPCSQVSLVVFVIPLDKGPVRRHAHPSQIRPSQPAASSVIAFTASIFGHQDSKERICASKIANVVGRFSYPVAWQTFRNQRKRHYSSVGL